MTDSKLDCRQQSLEGNNVIRQLFSRIEQLSNAISPRHNQVEVESEVKRTFTSGNSSRTSQEGSTNIDRPSRYALDKKSTNRYRPVNLPRNNMTPFIQRKTSSLSGYDVVIWTARQN